MKLLPLYAIETVAFLLIIAETYLFFGVVVPLGPISHSFATYTGLAILKVVLIAGLVVLWFVVMVGLTRLYVRSKTRTSPTPSS
jgi:hypothetical protein